MAWGTYVDIRQQDGNQIRMHYDDSAQSKAVTKWIGINEQMADKFVKEQHDEQY